MQPSQFWYHEFKNNRGSEESFNRIRERLKAFNGINSSDLINGNIKECLRFLIGVDKNDNIVLVADTSNDESFVDDPSVIIGRISYIPKAVRYCNFHFNKIELNARGDKIQTGFSVTVRIKPIVYANRQALVESLMGYNDDIALIQNSYKIGDIIVDNERYRIIINSNISRTIWEEINKSQLFFARQGVPVSKETLYKKLGDGDFYAVGDTLLLNGKFLTIEKISPYQDTITFLRVKGEDAFGIHDGFVIQDFSAEQINGEEFNLETIDRSYLILDFWGSWCEPCIKLLPKQKKIYKYFSKSLKGKINFISVAYDQRANMDKLKNYIVKFEMNWIHVGDDRENHC